MRILGTAALVTAYGALAVAVFGVDGVRAQSASAGGDSRSVWSGVYTAGQAARGQTQYAEHCLQCHGGSLEGDATAEIPALVYEEFLRKWSGRTAGELVTRVTRSMPPDAPGSLARTAYLDILAYVFEANGFPAGGAALDGDSDRLSRIRIERSSK